MNRRRTRAAGALAKPRKLDRPVLMYAYEQLPYAKWTEWRGRAVSLRKAQEMVAAGEARTDTRQWQGQIITIYQETKAARLSQTSPTTLTFATLIAVGCATTDARSRQAETRFQQTVGERAQVVKFRVWPMIGDTKAVAVRPRISDRERREAQKLLEPPRSVRQEARERGGSRTGHIRTLFIPEQVAA